MNKLLLSELFLVLIQVSIKKSPDPVFMESSHLSDISSEDTTDTRWTQILGAGFTSLILKNCRIDLHVKTVSINSLVQSLLFQEV